MSELIKFEDIRKGDRLLVVLELYVTDKCDEIVLAGEFNWAKDRLAKAVSIERIAKPIGVGSRVVWANGEGEVLMRDGGQLVIRSDHDGGLCILGDANVRIETPDPTDGLIDCKDKTVVMKLTDGNFCYIYNAVSYCITDGPSE